jgi:hypothetical protein
VRHTIEIRTPTGHSYHSTAPPLPGTPLSDTSRAATRLTEAALASAALQNTALPTSRRRKRQLLHHAKSLKRAHLKDARAA